MKLSMSTKRQIVAKQKNAYRRGGRKQKTHILDVLEQATGLSRDHLSRLLRDPEKYKKRAVRSGRGRKPIYGMAHKELLVYVWVLLGCPSSRRVKAAMPDVLYNLEEHQHRELLPEFRSQMLCMSHGTMDRLLYHDRRKQRPFGVSTTKPGSLLKSQIPVRRGTEWDDAVVGFMEIDLVAHCGSSTKGEFVLTLDGTDIASGWTECRAVINKARTHTLNAMKDIDENLPFALLGIDSDNGGEFINHHFHYYCKERDLCFTRSRPNHSNDSCYVEQKNWSVVRNAIGYGRFEGEEAVDLLNQFYKEHCLINNFFMPSQKLLERYREGGKVIKKHDNALSPYRRLMLDPCVDQSVKTQLEETFNSLDLVQLFQDKVKLLEKIEDLCLGY